MFETRKTYEVFQFKVGFNFNYIIVDKVSKKAAIIDPAWDLNFIMSMFDKLKVKPDIILLTHSHDDHVNMVEPLVSLFGSQVYMSKREIEFYNFRCKNLNEIDDTDIIHLGDTQINFLSTPGHTAGGMCFLLSNSLFSGDTIFIEGCGTCDTLGGSPEQMYESFQRIKENISPYVLVYPGHSYGKSPGHTLKHLLKNNIYFQFETKEQFVKFRTRKGQKNLFNFK
ncbi:MBL fold metallo-hydrolase [Bacillus sp. FJAT-26377]|nr:MBL fold metallo-hydrolase [Bacillus sp. FJAT-26377]